MNEAKIDKLLWAIGFTLDLVVVTLWIKEPLFFTWHFPVVLVLGVALGATTRVWRKP